MAVCTYINGLPNWKWTNLLVKRVFSKDSLPISVLYFMWFGTVQFVRETNLLVKGVFSKDSFPISVLYFMWFGSVQFVRKSVHKLEFH